MMRIFYELKLVDQAESMTDTLRHLVRSSEKPDMEYREAFSNYIKYFNKLLKLKTDEPKNKSVELKTIRDETKKEKNLIQRIWLNEKLEEMASGENYELRIKN